MTPIPNSSQHIPQRTCVACRRTGAKHMLLRFVRTTTGRIHFDPTATQPGRGAYLCHDPACWQMAQKRRSLQRALRLAAVHPDEYETLRQMLDHFAQARRD